MRWQQQQFVFASRLGGANVSPMTTMLSQSPIKMQPTGCGYSLPTTKLYLLSTALAFAALIALSVDFPLSQWLAKANHGGGGDLRRVINLFEAFAHGGGVLVILLAVAALDPASRKSIARLAACAFGAGGVNTVLKLLVGRTRPSEFWSATWPDSVSQSFLGLAPTLHSGGRDLFDRSMQSFPSGHSAVAAGLAVGLASIYPQGRGFFVFLAAMAMLQRVVTGAHFPSDVLAGASVGVFFATVCLDPRCLGRWFQRLEQRTA